MARAIFPVLIMSAVALQAAELRVCVEDHADIGAPARAGLVKELRALLPRLDLTVKGGGCGARAGFDVLLTVRDEKAGIPADALGLAHLRQGVILPEVEVFVEPVMQLTRVTDKETLGRALARVAAHELLHYRYQSDQHQAHGLMAARLSAAELLTEEARPRLVASLVHD
jgi:hypothetical protein